jgi:hypothetical protein
MATSTPVASRTKKMVRKTFTFDAGSGSGAVGTFAAFTVVGTVWVQCMNPHCLTDLTGANATIALGISGDTSALIPATTATTIDAGMQWNSAVPGKIDEPLTNFVLSDSLIFTIATANITAGVIEVDIIFESLSQDGYIS